MKVLVTGSAGFLGGHFAARLRADGHKVTGVDIANRSSQDILLGFRYGKRHFDLVLHLAAVSPHRAAIDSRALAVGVGNLALDAALFDWAARTKPGRVVYFSSSAAYPVDLQNDFARPHDLREDDARLDRLNVGTPDAIYGWVKLTGERLAAAYRAQGGAVTVVRPFSGYGEDQSADFPFGAFRDRALACEDPFTIWGDGSQVRDWVHVDDVVGAVLAAVEEGVDGPLNVCTGIGTSMRELAELFTAAAGYRPAYELVGDAPAGVAYRVGDPARMHEIYTPRVSIEEGVKRALEAAS
jgi:nucleoside-diphosphate-sugar epimerase